MVRSFSQFVEEKGVRVWLDDDRDPKDSKGKLKGARGDEVWVKTVGEAIELLKTGEVISISLDNDLNNLDHREEGYQVSNWIETMVCGKIPLPNGKLLPRLAWNVHSGNSVRIKSMITALQNADRCWDAYEQE